MQGSKQKNKSDSTSEFMRNLLRTMANFEEIKESDMNNKQFTEGLSPEEHSFAIMFLTISKFRREIMTKMAEQIKSEVKDHTKNIS